MKPARTIPFWMWGALAALLLFTVYTSWESVQLKEEAARSNQEVQTEIGKNHDLISQFLAFQRKEAILADSKSVRIPMVAQDKSAPKLEAAWHSELGIVVYGLNLPAPSGNRTLQLWLIPKTPRSKPIPSLALRPGTDGRFLLLVANPPKALDASKALAITEEPAGGSEAPTTRPIWVGTIG